MVGSEIVRSKQRCVAEGLGDVLTGNDRFLVIARVTSTFLQSSLRSHSADACAQQQRQLPAHQDSQKPPPFLTETTNNDSNKRGRRFYCELHHPLCQLWNQNLSSWGRTRTRRVRAVYDKTRATRVYRVLKNSAAGVYRVLHNIRDFNRRFDREILRLDTTDSTHRFSRSRAFRWCKNLKIGDLVYIAFILIIMYYISCSVLHTAYL